jgi:hypothetical protein
MTLDASGNFSPWTQPAYGMAANNEPVTPPTGYRLVNLGERLVTGDRPFDVYAGWLAPGYADYAARNGSHARSNGRWTAYARKKDSP